MSNINTITVGGTQYNIGGSGGLLPHIVITSDAENTITVTTPSGSTITPTSTVSGVWECDVDEYGTYTVTATYDEYEAEDTVVVDTVKVYAVEIHIVTIPDGSTVLPTDDVATWLLCADIKDKNYTTLSQVLSDSETFNALLGDSNACAYMARSTTWANDGLVPTMTSATTPSGEASGNNVNASYPAYLAFDGNGSTFCAITAPSNSATNMTDRYIQYDFPSSEVVKAVRFSYLATYSTYTASITKIKIQGYDGSAWVDIATINVSSTDNYYVFANSIAYSKYRLLIVDATVSNYTNIGYNLPTVQFYPEIPLVTNQYAMSMIGQYNVCCDALLGNATWASAIALSDYAEYVFDIHVPKMTGNTTPSGECFGDSVYSASYPYWYAFDGNRGTRWNNGQQNANATIGYMFTSAVTIKVVTLLIYGSAYPITNAVIWGYDGTNWNEIYTIGSVNDDSVHAYVMPSDLGTYTHYKLTATGTSNKCVTVYELQFYGRTDSGELIHGANDEIAYYLDGASEVAIVDLSTLSAGTYTFGSTVAKDPSDLTADYTKTIRITPNTKEIVLRPDCALYWYGNKVNCEECLNANGWQNTVYTMASGTTFNILSATINPTTNNSYASVGAKNAVAISSKVHMVAKALTGYLDVAGYITCNSIKNIAQGNDFVYTTIPTSDIGTTKHYECSVGYSSGYPTATGLNESNQIRSIELYALWCE